MRLFLAGLLSLGAIAAAHAQTKTAEQMLAEPAVQAAMTAIETNQPRFTEEQIRLTEIPAPPFHEEAKAAALKQLFLNAGLQNVRTDAVGNVLGDRPGDQPHPHFVLAAHLDTVFPEGTDVKVKHNGTVLSAPGIGDDDAGLAALLAVIDALQNSKIKTHGTITFVADVGEEGLGDSRGAKELFNTTLKGQIDEFISIDGGSPASITNAGVGSYRYRVTYSGRGGHSYGAFGLANPAHALGRTIAKIANFEAPTNPKTTYNVGRIGGGTSVNAIPFEAWFEFDERSTDTRALDALDVKFKAAVQAGLDEENAFRHDKGKLTVKVESVGVRPAGETAADSKIVKTVASSIVALHLGTPTLGDSSTDSNVPMHVGIPAVTLGPGGTSKGAHSLDESFDPTGSYRGAQNLFLIALLLVQ
jgi:tripeptide aminopeptidase